MKQSDIIELLKLVFILSNIAEIKQIGNVDLISCARSNEDIDKSLAAPVSVKAMWLLLSSIRPVC